MLHHAILITLKISKNVLVGVVVVAVKTIIIIYYNTKCIGIYTFN